jgi:hypothetical protein
MASATTVTETDVTIGQSPTRLDIAPLANRYWVRVVNPHATLRVFIGHLQATTNNVNCETADPYNGVWEDSLGPNVQVWARSEDATSITVRIKQYA